MEDFLYKNRVIKLISVTGEVVADRKLLETVVTSVGGSEAVAPDIESYAVPRHEFWIKSTDGGEYDFQLRDVDIPLRDGQKITVISAVSVGTGKVNPAVMVNHTAGKHWYIDKAPALLKKLNLPFISAGALGAVVALFVVGGILKSNPLDVLCYVPMRATELHSGIPTVAVVLLFGGHRYHTLRLELLRCVRPLQDSNAQPTGLKIP